VQPELLGRYHDGTAATFRASGSAVWLLSYLTGGWRIDRRLTDHRTGTAGSFAGPASFAPTDGSLLHYLEEGELAFGGHRGPASRKLIYRGRPDGTADVQFADGRAFYHLDARSGSWRGHHDCGRDGYDVTGELLDAASYQEHWRVHGPGKDYEIVTRLTRA
jgi:hypothetical protein